MKISSIIVATAFAFLIASIGDGQAATRAGYSAANLNIRSGPSVRFPAVGRVLVGSSMTIHGCVARYTWCDVSASGVRGWASAAHIQFVHEARRVYVPAYAAQSQIPVVTFNVGSYWNDYYRDYSFYGDIDRWSDHRWEDDGNPPGWRDNWEDEHAAPDHESAYDNEAAPDDPAPEDEPPPDNE